LGAVGALATTLPRAGWAVTAPSLNALAQSRGLRFGSAVAANAGGGIGNSKYTALLEAECGLLVAENEMKWQALRPSPTRFDFKGADAIMDYATRKGLALRGHNLLWNRPQWQPAWIKDYDFCAKPASEAASLLSTHINTVCARYQGRIMSYDVVNETVLPETGALAETDLSKAMGGTEALVDLAFHTARAAAPHAQLVYNDYMSWEPGNETHRTGVLKFLEGLRQRGTPVDALGVQSHLIAQDARPQERAWRSFIDAVTGMGYSLLITEFDVRDAALPKDITKRDAGVAALGKAYLDMMFAYPQLRDVLAWGLVDRFSWLQNFEPRKDGAPTRGCLFDDDYRAQPLRAAVAAAFTSAPKR
jgi:endo-1,4-beta-xylanase